MRRPAVSDRVRRGAIAFGVAGALAALGALVPDRNGLQGWVTDITTAARIAVFGAKPLDSQHVLIVGMDERSLVSPELSALPRTLFSPVYAALARKVLDHGGRGLILDLIIAYDAKSLPIGDKKPLENYDKPFLTMLLKERRTGRIVLGRGESLLPVKRFAVTARAQGMGLIKVVPGPGNVVREAATALELEDGGSLATLSGRALALLDKEAPRTVDIVPPASLATLPSASLIDVLRCDDPAVLRRVLEDRIVFLGGMLPAEDRLSTPDRMVRGPPAGIVPENPCELPRPVTRQENETTLPGVFVHAAAVDAIASNWQPARPPDWVWHLLNLAAGLVGAWLALRLKPAYGIAVLGGAIVVIFALGVTALEAGVLLATGHALALAPLAFGASYGVRIGILDRDARAIRREFGRFLSPILVEQISVSGKMPELGGEERDVTVLFADLSGFTATSETMESGTLMSLVNRYLDGIAKVIQARGGYIDKFIGDAVMAIWNAPGRIETHALAAVDAALAIERVVAATAAEDRAAGRAGFGIKIGIASGPATVGNVGSRERLNYTVIGETVNLAARFESLPSLFQTPIVMGPDTAAAVAEKYALLPIVSIQVKGKTTGVRVHAPLALRAEITPELTAALEDYALALAAFEEGSFETAADLWTDLASRDWPGAGPAGVMAGEAAHLSRQVLLTPWNGVLEARGK